MISGNDCFVRLFQFDFAHIEVLRRCEDAFVIRGREVLLFDAISFHEEIRLISFNILHLWRMKHVDIRPSEILENDNLSKLRVSKIQQNEITFNIS